jgi:uncharacterized protein (TIGR02246 family)
MKLIKLLSAAVILSALSIPVSAKSDSTEMDIKATINGLEKALNENNIKELKNIYTDRAMVVPVQAAILDDYSAIISFWNQQLNKGKSHYRIDVIDMQVNRNIARLSAMWSATVTTGGDSTQILDGYMTNVLERQPDGNWKIRMQNWN